MTQRGMAPPDRRLVDLVVGERAWIVRIDGPDVDRLAVLGARPGAMVVVDGDAPFRGPRIVSLGAARIALSRTVAASVLVRADDPAGPAR